MLAYDLENFKVTAPTAGDHTHQRLLENPRVTQQWLKTAEGLSAVEKDETEPQTPALGVLPG